MGIRIALAGNPNSGKTTMFNSLTGANQYVGNWPGVTVEKKEGKYSQDKEVIITDLPGVYSLSPYSPEEVVSRDYLMSGEPDVVINLIDATNLERNLYLATQIIDLGIPVVIALNMADLVKKNGDKIDIDQLSDQLGCPIVQTSALRKTGLDELMSTAMRVAKEKVRTASKMSFDEAVETALAEISSVIDDRVYPHLMRWYSVKLFEGEEKTITDLKLSAGEISVIDAIRERVEAAEDDDAESIITGERYSAITNLVSLAYKRSAKSMNLTQKIDRVLTNRFLGLIIFALIMIAVYGVAIGSVGTLVTDWANDGLFGDGWYLGSGQEEFDAATEAWEEAGALESAEPDPADYGIWVTGVPVLIEGWLTNIGAADWVISLINDGIVGGVGAVLGFVPQMIILFLMLTFLEGCGYMARVAFIMDRIFRKFGLSGKSFIPMLISSGCGVPGVMATKTIENEKDRRMTIMTTTMIPCGAKTPIIALIIGSVANQNMEGTWWVAPLFYFLGVIAIIISGIMLKKTKWFAGEATPFIMELPQYHLPAIKNLLLGTWERVRSFIVKAGTIIFISSIIIWFLLNFGVYEGQFGMLDAEMDGYIQYSLMAMIGSAIAWIFAPLGFANWEATVATITGWVAKENVVSTVGIITSLGEEAEGANLWTAFAALFGGATPAILAFCAFNMLCMPCFAAVGAIRKQMSSAKWTAFAIAYLMLFAYAIGLMIYQFGGLITGEVSFNFWTVVAGLVLAGMLFQLFRPMPKYKESHEPISGEVQWQN